MRWGADGMGCFVGETVVWGDSLLDLEWTRNREDSAVNPNGSLHRHVVNRRLNRMRLGVTWYGEPVLLRGCRTRIRT